jgi:hypothetical protein
VPVHGHAEAYPGGLVVAHAGQPQPERAVADVQGHGHCEASHYGGQAKSSAPLGMWHLDRAVLGLRYLGRPFLGGPQLGLKPP